MRQPTFGWEGEKARFCSAHKVDGMLDVKVRVSFFCSPVAWLHDIIHTTTAAAADFILFYFILVLSPPPSSRFFCLEKKLFIHARYLWVGS